jgi:hypothetical protein
MNGVGFDVHKKTFRSGVNFLKSNDKTVALGNDCSLAIDLEGVRVGHPAGYGFASGVDRGIEEKLEQRFFCRFVETEARSRADPCLFHLTCFSDENVELNCSLDAELSSLHGVRDLIFSALAGHRSDNRDGRGELT